MIGRRSAAWSARDSDPEGGGAGEAMPLFGAPAKSPAGRLARFLAFHRANPGVLQAVIQIARNLKASGVTKGAVKLVWEELRRVYSVEVETEEKPRLNNDWTALYARLAIARAPDLEGYFELRRIRENFDPGTVRP